MAIFHDFKNNLIVFSTFIFKRRHQGSAYVQMTKPNALWMKEQMKCKGKGKNS